MSEDLPDIFWKLTSVDRREAQKIMKRIEASGAGGVVDANRVKRGFLKNLNQVFDVLNKHPDYPDIGADIRDIFAEIIERLDKEKEKHAVASSIRKKLRKKIKGRRPSGRYAKIDVNFKGRGRPFQGGLPQ